MVPGASERLQSERGAVAAGEPWRVVSGHWTHWTADHLLWDALAFLCLGALCERRAGRARFLGCVGLSALAASASVAWGCPGINVYRGLSGIDSGLFVLALASLAGGAKPVRRALLAFLLAAFFGKVAWEWRAGATLFVDSSGAFIPLPLAHLAGGLAGAAASFRLELRGRPIWRLAASKRGGSMKAREEMGRR